jgi:Zn-finger nucleic acid-binding protein
MTPMNFGRRSGVIIDVCRAHGTWFDRGELDAVLDFVGSGGIEPDVEGRERSEELTPEARRLVKEAEAAMRAEALAAQVEATAFVRAADDLVWILFGPGYRNRRR